MPNTLLLNILKDLLLQSSAMQVVIEGRKTAMGLPSSDWRSYPLGNSAVLKLRSLSASDPSEQLQIQQCIRRLRRVYSEHALLDWPNLSVPPPRQSRLETARLRAVELAQALNFDAQSSQVLACLRGEIVASAAAILPQQRDRLPLLLRQLDRAKNLNTTPSSHGEIVQDDAFAQSFWYGGSLVVFEARSPDDFLRYRAKIVGRALIPLFEILDEGPTSPVAAGPTP